MLVYAGASAVVAYLIKPIIDKVLPGAGVAAVHVLGGDHLVVYLLKGLGSYVSTYLMADIGQRVVLDLRNQLFRHILGQSAALLRAGGPPAS